MVSGDMLEVRGQEYLPSPANTLPGFSGNQPPLDASRTFAPDSFAKYWSAGPVETAADVANARGGGRGRGAWAAGWGGSWRSRRRRRGGGAGLRQGVRRPGLVRPSENSPRVRELRPAKPPGSVRPRWTRAECAPGRVH